MTASDGWYGHECVDVLPRRNNMRVEGECLTEEEAEEVINPYSQESPTMTVTTVNEILYRDHSLSIGDVVNYTNTDTPMGIVTAVENGLCTVQIQGQVNIPNQVNRNGRVHPPINVVENFSHGIPPQTSGVQLYENATDQTIVMGNTEHPEFIKLCENGDIIIKGRKIDNDICLVDAMREFLEGQGLYSS